MDGLLLIVEISDAQHMGSHPWDRYGSTADVWGRLEDWDDGVAAARSESRHSYKAPIEMTGGRDRPLELNPVKRLSRPDRLGADWEIEGATSALIEWAWLRVSTPTAGTGRPTVKFEINPRVSRT